MMKRTLLLLSGLLCSTVAAHADILGATVGAGFWHQQSSGFLRYQGGNMDLQNNLGISNDNGNFAWVTIEHPLPLIPDFRFQYNKLALNGQHNTTVTFGGNTFTGPVSTDGSLNQFDATMYYQLLDNWVNLDLGLDIKHISGSFALTDSSSHFSKSFSKTIPMFYGSAVFDLPFTGLSAGVSGSGVDYNNNRVTDYTAKISYEWSGGLGVQGGWRRQQLKLNNVGGVYSDIKVKGPFLDLFYHF